MQETIKITVETEINTAIQLVWDCWTKPSHITQWNQASDDWHTPRAENDLRVGGQFTTRMEAKDGSMGFDFEGIYTDIVPLALIKYVLEDGREVSVEFHSSGEDTKVIEIFDAEYTNPIEMQQAGWQAILDSFKKYTESISHESVSKA